MGRPLWAPRHKASIRLAPLPPLADHVQVCQRLGGDRDDIAGADALAAWDDNGNGRITCAEARRHGIAPVPRGHPAYQYMRDGDGDGVVCE